MNSSLDEKMMDYLDGLLPAEERAQLERELLTSPRLRERLEMFRLLAQTFSKQSVQQPAKDFTESVLSDLHRKRLGAGFSPRNGFLLFVGVVVAVLVVSFFLGNGFYGDQLNIATKELALPQLKQSIPAFNVNSNLIINGILIVASAISFVVLDRTVLKPLFQKRMHPF
jgi:hypothetical protein